MKEVSLFTRGCFQRRSLEKISTDKGIKNELFIFFTQPTVSVEPLYPPPAEYAGRAAVA